MRESRLAKFKKKKMKKITLFIMMQVLVISCLGIYGLVGLTSPTNASFNDIERLSFPLKADWDSGEEPDGEWDKSSLEFFENKGSYGCGEGGIFATVQNGTDSSDMKGPVTYEVYFAVKGNPKNGEIVASGEVPKLKAGETYKLTYKPVNEGSYKFKAYQRLGHPGKGELWSETVTFNKSCLPDVKGTTSQPRQSAAPTSKTEKANSETPNKENRGDSEGTKREDTKQEDASKDKQQDQSNETTNEEKKQRSKSDVKPKQSQDQTNDVEGTNVEDENKENSQSEQGGDQSDENDA